MKRLAFLQRLLTGLADSIDDHDVPHFVAEARALQLEETDGVGRLVAHQRMLALAARGPEAIDHASDGRAVTTAMPSPSGKRRTSTTFVFWRDSDYSREVILQVWQRRKA